MKPYPSLFWKPAEIPCTATAGFAVVLHPAALRTPPSDPHLAAAVSRPSDGRRRLPSSRGECEIFQLASVWPAPLGQRTRSARSHGDSLAFRVLHAHEPWHFFHAHGGTPFRESALPSLESAPAELFVNNRARIQLAASIHLKRTFPQFCGRLNYHEVNYVYDDYTNKNTHNRGGHILLLFVYSFVQLLQA